MYSKMPEFRIHSSISEIGRERWDRLCGTDYPFLRYDFLAALEASGSVQPDTGWQPLHLLAEVRGEAVAAVPLYLKSHSFGEYVFDWSWADAYRRHGLDYYPKLLTAIPFTPAWGPRIGVAPAHRDDVIAALPDVIREIAGRVEASSWHALFIDPPLRRSLSQAGLTMRLGTQYHWFNQGFATFDDFLEQFASRKRKGIRRERRKVDEQGIRLRRLTGAQIDDDLLQTFYRFYQSTYRKRGREGYLTADFFQLLCDRMPEQLLLVIAEYHGQPVAGALSLRSRTTLYGRYWGCDADFDSLHFETCYYQGIEHCIEYGLERFDPGAQGEHKIQRGFRPVETWSAHWIDHPGFAEAIDRAMEEERTLMREQIAELTDWLPFRKA